MWGRGETVDAIKKRVPQGVEIIEFGPKRSIGVVLDGVDDMEDLARRLAFDVIMYDQEACFSCREIFCQSSSGELADALADALDRYEQVIPRRELGVDQDAHVQRARIEAMTNGWRVLQSANTEWTVIITDGPVRLDEHPLARVLYIHPVLTSDEILNHIDNDVQSVTIAPWTRCEELADAVTAAGADRVAPPGSMSRFRPGVSHDGFYPMNRMVRCCALEAGSGWRV